MKERIKIVVFSVLVIICFSCNLKEKDYNENINELNEYINNIEKPRNVKFKIYELNSNVSRIGPSDNCLVAILTYSKDDFLRIKNEIVKEEPVDIKFIKKDDKLAWFPKSVTDEFVLKGDLYYSIKAKSYKANCFYKDPYIHGFCFFTDQNEIFLSLYAL
ncbi:hypothetical protein [Flavobacterium cerinum]|uniref:Lipoprotein n=1 Tax=Flavobacterium cerinum TaxID=2502784 RepID=A0ABY5IV55_9FLAO|nr:hypothetical protein [Flavobacterium cerinum]UUC46703.1 hypothetical protein NOX80_05760 [Flavobacterium cerinum]UUC46708.1 hypothetical protein NOX80_05785 [Flavobacterium cerinum]